MSRERKNESEFVVYRGRGGIMTKAIAIPGRPPDEVPVDEEGKVDISGLSAELEKAGKGPFLDHVPFKRHHRH